MSYRYVIVTLLVFALAGCSGAESTDEGVGTVTETVTETVAEVVTETATETVTETVTERPTGQLNRLRRQVRQKDRTINRLRSRIDNLESQLAAAPDSDSGSAPVFYENCDAARAAGDAPVYAGDPGYGPHLDADGDGVGCE